MKKQRERASHKTLAKKLTALERTIAASFEERLKNIHSSAEVDPVEFMDLASHSENDELSARLAEAEARKMSEIEETLDRLVEGEYGKCEGCGEKISRRRLKAVPTASLCLDCKQLEEQGYSVREGEAVPDADALNGFGLQDTDDGEFNDDLLRETRYSDLID